VSGGVRKAFVILPTIITIGVIAWAGTAVIEQRQDRSDRVAEAEKVGSTYFSDVATFRAGVQADLAKVKGGEPVELKKVLDADLKRPPVLGPAPDGAEASKTYRAAVKASATALDPYKKLSKTLARVVDAEDFVAAADKVLSHGPIVVLGYGLVLDSKPLREKVIPELNRGLAEFRAVTVPKGAGDVATKVDAAVAYAIGQVSRMADRADQGSSYEFSYGTQYDAARQAVQDYATEIDGDVEEALDRIAGPEPT
jgi:hypothetical protein